LDIDSRDMIYATDSESSDTIHQGWKQGLRIGSARDGSVLFFVPGSSPEGVAVDAVGTIYGADVGARGLIKFVRR
jgi:sugar lactone lactonase YvrE